MRSQRIRFVSQKCYCRIFTMNSCSCYNSCSLILRYGPFQWCRTTKYYLWVNYTYVEAKRRQQYINYLYYLTLESLTLVQKHEIQCYLLIFTLSSMITKVLYNVHKVFSFDCFSCWLQSRLDVRHAILKICIS